MSIVGDLFKAGAKGAEKEAVKVGTVAAKQAMTAEAEAAAKLALKESRGGVRAAEKELTKVTKGTNALAMEAAAEKKRIADTAAKEALEKSKKLADAKRVGELRRMAEKNAPKKAAKRAEEKVIQASKDKISRLEALKAEGKSTVPFLGKDGKTTNVSIENALLAEKNRLKNLTGGMKKVKQVLNTPIKAPQIKKPDLSGVFGGAGAVARHPLTKLAATGVAAFAIGKYTSGPAGVENDRQDTIVASTGSTGGSGILLADNRDGIDPSIYAVKWSKDLDEVDTKTDAALKSSEHEYKVEVNTGVESTVYDPSNNIILKADTSNMSLLWKTVSTRFREELIGKTPDQIKEMTGAGKGEIVERLLNQAKEDIKKAVTDYQGDAPPTRGNASRFIGDKTSTVTFRDKAGENMAITATGGRQVPGSSTVGDQSQDTSLQNTTKNDLHLGTGPGAAPGGTPG